MTGRGWGLGVPGSLNVIDIAKKNHAYPHLGYIQCFSLWCIRALKSLYGYD